MRNLHAVAERFGLGTVLADPAEHHGGVNRLWRLETERGAFSVHERLGLAAGVDALERCDRVHELERAAAAAGVRIAGPVVDPSSGRAAAALPGFDGPVVVHAWVDAEPADIERTALRTYGRLGSSLARVHALDVGVRADPAGADVLDRHPTADDWHGLAGRAADTGWPWSSALAEAADELAESLAIVDGWERSAAEPAVYSHRDLTSQNVLDDRGEPVLIDWEDAGPIGPGNELGRTALDNLWRDGRLDQAALRAYLEGYAAVRPLPALGAHWCALWVRGLVIYAEHCARSCLEGTASPRLRELQEQVIGTTPAELRRRLSLVDAILGEFDAASRSG